MYTLKQIHAIWYMYQTPIYQSKTTCNKQVTETAYWPTLIKRTAEKVSDLLFQHGQEEAQDVPDRVA